MVVTKLDNLKYNLNRYYNLLNGVRNAVASLNVPSSNLSSINKNLTTYFNYDGVGVDNYKIRNTKSDIDNVIRTVNNEVIPAIKNQIWAINREIKELEKEGL